MAAPVTDRSDVPLIPGASGWRADEIVWEMQRQVQRNRGNWSPVSLTPRRMRLAAALKRKKERTR